jgi:hypothetical protein
MVRALMQHLLRAGLMQPIADMLRNAELEQRDTFLKRHRSVLRSRHQGARQSRRRSALYMGSPI